MTAAPNSDVSPRDTAGAPPSARPIPFDHPLEKDVALRRTRRRVLHRNLAYLAAVALAVALSLLALAALVRWAP